MNEDIKEIFNKYGKFHYDDNYCLEFETYIVELKELKILHDYITNLQEENKELNRVVELYGKSLYNADLTRYKEENKKLKETNEEHRKINGDLRKENQKLVKVIDELEDWLIKGVKNYSLNDFYRLGLEKTFNKLTELKGGSDDNN